MRLEINPNPSEALKHDKFNKHISIEDSSTEMLQTLRHGIESAKAGNRNEARVLLMRVVEVEPKNETAWLWLASISEYPEELLVFLQNVLSINPENQRAIEWTKQTKSLLAKNVVQRGVIASQENQKDVARQCFLQAIAHDNQNEMAWLWLASIVESAEEKISHLKKVLSINPENETAISSLKMVKNQMAQAVLKRANQAVVVGDRETARNYLQEAMKHDDKCEEVWLLKALITDSFDEKVGYFGKVLEINPENESAKAGLISIEAVMKSVVVQPKVKQAVHLEEKVETFSQKEIQHSIEESFAQEIAENKVEEVAKKQVEEPLTDQFELDLFEETQETITEFEHQELVEETIEEVHQQVETVQQEVSAQSEEEVHEVLAEVETQEAELENSEETVSELFEDSQKQEVVLEESAMAEDDETVVEEIQETVVENQTETVVEEIFEVTNEPQETVEFEQQEVAVKETDEALEEKAEEQFFAETDEDYLAENQFFTKESEQSETLETITEEVEETKTSESFSAEYAENQYVESAETENYNEVEQTEEFSAVDEVEQIKESVTETDENQTSNFAEAEPHEDNDDDNLLDLSSNVEAKSETLKVEQAVETVETKQVEETAVEKEEAEEVIAVEVPKSQEVAEKEIGYTSFSNFNPEEGLKDIGSYSFTKLKPEEFRREIGDYSFLNLKAEETKVEETSTVSFEQPVHSAIEELAEMKAETVAEETYQVEESVVEHAPVEELAVEPAQIEVAKTEYAQFFVPVEKSAPVVEAIVVEEPIFEKTPEQVEPKVEGVWESLESKVEAMVEAAGEKHETHFQICPFCSGANSASEVTCNSCQATMDLSDVQTVLENNQVNRDVVFDAIRRKELEKLGKEFSDEDYRMLGLAYLNVHDVQNAHENLKLALHFNPMSVELNSHVMDLAEIVELHAANSKSQEKAKAKVSHTILVVDDSPTVRKLISSKLERHGHTVVSAVDGMDALAKINEVVPDLILLDITMPRLDGYQVCKLIRNNELTKTTPVVMISGKDGFFDKVRGRMAGSTDFISKPFGPEILMKMLETHIH
jgi:twitching motility two-component system response regulator PilG